MLRNSLPVHAAHFSSSSSCGCAGSLLSLDANECSGQKQKERGIYLLLKMRIQFCVSICQVGIYTPNTINYFCLDDYYLTTRVDKTQELVTSGIVRICNTAINLNKLLINLNFFRSE